MLALLRDAYPDAVPTRCVLEALYGDDPNGGPETANVVVANYIRRLRKSGYDIPRGGKLRGYRLRA